MTGGALCWAAAAQVSCPGPESGPPPPTTGPPLGEAGPFPGLRGPQGNSAQRRGACRCGAQGLGLLPGHMKGQLRLLEGDAAITEGPRYLPGLQGKQQDLSAPSNTEGLSTLHLLHSPGPFPSPMTGPGGPWPHTEWHRRPIPPVAPPTPAQCPGWCHLVAKSLQMQDLVPPEPPTAQSLRAAPSGWRRPPAGHGVATGKASGRSIPAMSVTIAHAAFGQGPRGAGVLPARRHSEDSRDAGRSRP